MKGWVGLVGWLCTEIVSRPQTVTHPGNNRVWRSATTLIAANALPLSQTANPTKTSKYMSQPDCKWTKFWLLLLRYSFVIHSLTHSLVDLPRWGLATADDHSDIFLLHCARSCDISFSWMYLQPVHSSMSCIHCLLGLLLLITYKLLWIYYYNWSTVVHFYWHSTYMAVNKEFLTVI